MDPNSSRGYYDSSGPQYNSTIDSDLNTKEGNFATVLLITVVLVIIIAAIVTVIILLFRNTQVVETPDRPIVDRFFTTFGLNSAPGNSEDGSFLFSNCVVYRDQPTCEADKLTRQWVNGQCQCVTPFWGLRGTRETYDFNYNAIGIPEEIIADNTKEVKTDRLSFPLATLSNNQTICTKQCDLDDNCVGVLANKGSTSNISGYSCSLLYGNVVSEEPIPFYPLIDSTLYMKRSKGKGRPLFVNNVLVYAGDKSLPFRFWVPDTETLKQSGQNVLCTKNVCTGLSFIPTMAVNDGKLFGVYSNNFMTQEDAEKVVNSRITPPGYFVTQAEEFVLPAQLTNAQIWVIYVAKSTSV